MVTPMKPGEMALYAAVFAHQYLNPPRSVIKGKKGEEYCQAVAAYAADWAYNAVLTLRHTPRCPSNEAEQMLDEMTTRMRSGLAGAGWPR